MSKELMEIQHATTRHAQQIAVADERLRILKAIEDLKPKSASDIRTIHNIKQIVKGA